MITIFQPCRSVEKFTRIKIFSHSIWMGKGDDALDMKKKAAASHHAMRQLLNPATCCVGELALARPRLLNRPQYESLTANDKYRGIALIHPFRP